MHTVCTVKNMIISRAFLNSIFEDYCDNFAVNGDDDLYVYANNTMLHVRYVIKFIILISWL